MAEEVKNLFGGFNAIVDKMFIPSERGGGQEVIPELDPEDIEKTIGSLDNNQDDDLEPVPAKNKKEPTKPKKVEKDEEPNDDDEEIDEEESSNISDKKKSDGKTDEIDYEEKEIVDAFSDLFAEELGWKYEDGTKPENIKDLVKHMQSIIDENSQPKYASDEIKELDEFVKNGGRLSNFYEKVYNSDIDDVDKLDLTKKENQKAIIKENLRNKGYSEQRIDKQISRYEDNDVLEDEANDSIPEVKEFREKTRKELLEYQKIQSDQQVREQLSFVRNVEKIVKDVDNIRGISISDKEKRELLEYIFKPERDGSTKYQKEYNDSLNNLVESAYFTKNRNTIVKEIQKKASSDAVKNLKLKLKSQGKSTRNTQSDMDESSSKVTQLWEIASKELKSFS
jgi:hypothetical protein